MKWTKLGKIFDPTEHKLADNCVQFAQSPQALVFSDFVRIYFSTREKDQNGKYLSHVAYVDMDKQLSRIIRISDQTIIPLGNLGCFDEHGIFPMNVLRDGDRILAYTGGWNRKVSVSVDGSIGMAVSKDAGKTFQKIGQGPVLTASLNEPFLVGDPFVLKIDNLFYMWYVYGVRWITDTDGEKKERVYKLGLATSVDGQTWKKLGRQIVDDRIGINECQALPTVIWHQDFYHLFFCYRQPFDFRDNKEKSYRIGYARSTDLFNWLRDDGNIGISLAETGWDSQMMCYPHVFRCDGQIFMLYNGNEFGRFGFGLARLDN